MKATIWDVIVIGGGSSGMMAAGRAGARGKSVLLLEKNRSLGQKLNISGGGRCNITHAQYDIHTLLAHYGNGAPFLYSSFSQFGIAECFSFFEELGLPLVVQARNRAFPQTEKASDVTAALGRYMDAGSVTVCTNSAVKKINTEKGMITSVVTNTETYQCKTLILATGGVSHPETGSTGDGFAWLRNLGHTVSAPTPTIVPLAVAESWVHMLSGVSLSFMKITLYLEDKKQFSKKGKILFTHFGLSGPLVLNMAGVVGGLLESGKVTARIDAYPDTDIPALEARIIAVFDANKNKMLKTVFKDIVPDGAAPGIMHLLRNSIDMETKVHSVTKTQRRLIVDTLKNLPVTITSLMGYDRAVVADGGVPLEEIDMKTYASKKIPNLFITGDLLHITRPSGGFSLQLCWTSGFVAGNTV